MMETLVINMFGGPGAGKSTLALELSAHLKHQGANIEYVPEYVKGAAIWGKNHNLFNDQLYIFAKQRHHIRRLIGQVNYVVTDSPILLSVLYNQSEPHLNSMMLSEFNRFNNLNFYINRVKAYNPAGRYQTEEEAREVDTSVLNMLKTYDIPFVEIEGKKGAAEVMERHIRRAWELLLTKEAFEFKTPNQERVKRFIDLLAHEEEPKLPQSYIDEKLAASAELGDDNWNPSST